MIKYLNNYKISLICFFILYSLASLYLIFKDKNEYIKIDLSENISNHDQIYKMNYVLTILDHSTIFELDNIGPNSFENLSQERIIKKYNSLPLQLYSNNYSINKNHIFNNFMTILNENLNLLADNFYKIDLVNKGKTDKTLILNIENSSKLKIEEYSKIIKNFFRDIETKQEIDLIENLYDYINKIHERSYDLTILKLYNLYLATYINSENISKVKNIDTDNQTNVEEIINYLKKENKKDILIYYNKINNSKNEIMIDIANLYLRQYYDKKILNIEFINKKITNLENKFNKNNYKSISYNLDNLYLESKQSKIYILLTFSGIFLFLILSYYFIIFTFKNFNKDT